MIYLFNFEIVFHSELFINIKILKKNEKFSIFFDFLDEKLNNPIMTSPALNK